MVSFRCLSSVTVACAVLGRSQAHDSLMLWKSPRAYIVQASKVETAATAKLRLVDTTGTSPNVGLLQVRTGNGEFGTVCGMNLGAADVVCRQLGYDFGSVGSACGTYGGADICGDAGVPVAMKDLTCEGGELQIQDCQWASPDAGCSDHSLDSVLYCGTEGTAGIINEGSLRILSHDGAPSIDGEGRLEIFKAGGWAPVCNTGFTAGAEMVACKSMGFDGVKPSSVPGNHMIQNEAKT